ncbi:MAG: histidine kinase [Fusobacterium sp.]|uniref:histidine kinase n=1 Tax=Fusobacterium sp. TaxID=68766 RepID=UPI0026DB0F27|nr:histidine kinase [Fusobacterium sp.]MDO4690795.1 histidine kinase [Fusobacterium sp.]
MNFKAKKFEEFLKKNNIECFQRETIKDELKTTVFRSVMEVEGQNLPTVIVTDISIYTIVRVQIAAKLLKDIDSEKLLTYLNKLNSEYKLFKYYVTETGDLCLDSCIVSTEDNFDVEIIYTSIDVILKHLIEHYPILMKHIWSIKK